MLLVRMNESATPVNFTAAERDAFTKEDFGAFFAHLNSKIDTSGSNK